MFCEAPPAIGPILSADVMPWIIRIAPGDYYGCLRRPFRGVLPVTWAPPMFVTAEGFIGWAPIGILEGLTPVELS